MHPALSQNPVTTFIYQDARGNITYRQIEDSCESEHYLHGMCTLRSAFRTFRKDRIFEVVTNSDDIESKLKHYISISPPPKAPPRSHHFLDVCITGFKSEDKKRLKQMCEKVGMIVRGSVTRNLDFLCCGYNAGPKKLEKARAQNTIPITENQLIQILETGELPEF